ncbi:MAG TPA: hypothetical protein PLN00_08160 [Smithellaceae bacterium]|nr:hypothetical protein [Smithellaceae bacterium]
MFFRKAPVCVPENNRRRAAQNDLSALSLILILGLAIRLFAWGQTDIMNSDGTVYIQQARAIYFGLWDAVTSCTIRYPYINSLLIAGFYALCKNWVTAATAVSVFFGVLTLIPLYGLSRNFFSAGVSFLIALIHAMNPMLVDGSVDIIRDPVCWFFTLCGLWVITRPQGRLPSGLLLACVAFILAIWARIESVIFFLVTPLWLLLDGRERPWRRILIFVAPAALLLLMGFGIQWLWRPDSVSMYRLQDIPLWLTRSFAGYTRLNATLREMIFQSPQSLSPEFLQNLKDIIWFVGFGVVFQNALETFFYPFVILYLMGLGGLRKRIAADGRIVYLLLLTLTGFLLLYLMVFIDWQMENRWLAIVLFPSFFFLGAGLERLISWLHLRFNLKQGAAIVLIGLAVLAATLPKDIKPRGEDKVIYRTIGETIADREGSGKKIEIMTVGVSSRWILFYANLGFRGAPCPDEFYHYREWDGREYGPFVERMKAKGMKYLVWEERNWPADWFDFLLSPYGKDFVLLGQWSHPDTGKILLFRAR